MKRGLVLAGRTPESPVHWAIAEDDSVSDTGLVRTLADVPPAVLSAGWLAVVLPGDPAATRRLALPVKGDRALNDAAALAFEDILSSPVEGFHLAWGPLQDGRFRMVCAYPTELLKDWMAALQQHGMDPDLLTVDHLAVGGAGTASVVLERGERAIARLPEGGMSGDAPFILPLAEAAAGEARLQRVTTGAAPGGPVGAGAEAVSLPDDRALAAFFLAGLTEEGIVNLRRGPFARRRDWMALAKAWRVPAGLMAACLGLWAMTALTDAIKHDRAAARLDRQATQTFTSAYPGTPVRDLRRQAAARAGAAGGATDFLPLATRIAEAVEDAENVQVIGLTFSLQDQLAVDLRFPDAAALERLKADLEADGIRTRESGNLRREENGDYSGRLYLGGGA